MRLFFVNPAAAESFRSVCVLERGYELGLDKHAGYTHGNPNRDIEEECGKDTITIGAHEHDYSECETPDGQNNEHKDDEQANGWEA